MMLGYFYHENFRPISLLNCGFKIFPKVVTNRFSKIIDRLIAYCQSGFTRGRFILESVATPHEVIHVIHKRKEHGLVFKIDYEKAYDKINLEARWFGPKIIALIMQLTQGG
jgi:hypothetical protein